MVGFWHKWHCVADTRWCYWRVFQHSSAIEDWLLFSVAIFSQPLCGCWWFTVYYGLNCGRAGRARWSDAVCRLGTFIDCYRVWAHNIHVPSVTRFRSAKLETALFLALRVYADGAWWSSALHHRAIWHTWCWWVTCNFVAYFITKAPQLYINAFTHSSSLCVRAFHC